MKNTAKKIGLLAVLVAVAILLVFTALRRPPKPAALSRAAKERIEALDDALKHGLISRTEHDKRVAQIAEDDSLQPATNQTGPNDDPASSPAHEN